MSEKTAASSSAFVAETVRFYLELARRRASGTVCVRLAEGRVVCSLDQGRIRDLAFDDRGTLERVFAPIVTPADLKKAHKLAAKNGISTGEAVLELGLLSDEQAAGAVLGFVTETFARTLVAEEEEISFTPCAEGAENLPSDLGSSYEIYVPLEELLLKALAQAKAWSFVVENFATLRDVYYATPSAVRFFHHQAEHPAAVAVLQILDGHKDTRDVIEASGLDPFEAFAVVQELAEGGDIELVNPVQLFQLGLAAEESGNWAKALSLYQRALERGLDDFDLQFRLAHACERTGRTAAAIERYLEFADKCARDFRFDDTLRAFRKIIALDAANIPIRRRYIKLLAKYEQKEEAARESLALAEKLHQDARDDEALRLLKDALAACPDDAALKERYAALCEATGAAEEARQAKEQLAKIYADRKDTSKALEYFQRLFINGDDTLDVRMKLIELHCVQGNREKALQHLDAVLAFGNPYGVRDPETLRGLHQKRCELRPGDRDSSWHLIESALARKDLPAAEKLLREYTARLGAPEERAELIIALKRLLRIAPENHEYRWQLAKEHEKSGNDKEAAAALRHAATLCAAAGDLKEAERALREALRVAPFEREAREELIAVLAGMNEKEKRLEAQRGLALIRLLAGELDKAQALCREIAGDRAEDAFLLLLLADACADAGDTRMAVEQYGRAGKMLLAGGNAGLARSCADKLRALGAPAAVIDEIQAAIDQSARPRAAPPPAGRSAPAASAAPAAPKSPEAMAADEAFASVKQRVLKRSVSSITRRLRSLTTGKPTGAPAPESVKLSVASAINKLKNITAPQAATPPPAGEAAPRAAAPPAEINPAPDVIKPAKLGGLATKLAALKAAKGGPAAQTQPAAGAAAPAVSGEAAPLPAEINPTPDVTKPAKLGGLAAKLAALKAAKGGPAAQTQPAGGAAAPAVSGEATPPAPPPAEINPTPDVTKPAKLGGAAARLAALKAAKGGAASQAQPAADPAAADEAAAQPAADRETAVPETLSA
ncbi:MAG TPA: tetratricopeptide repeat protein [Planctomycetota bacterium]|nr:tetratricopeptide repeat protein [Planctomycetota bacterium]HNR98523.1 tetratricopeptide repeat protein [Planctomycetota bacterium]HNU26217.1 tetratricopeptide repeat protein [Planctomycetota bacterium]HOE28747.1 tetratricopeptide repeat protein [Planctomycetota bacterium]HOE85494.1 tetratricopeptide repeat protein [Planctomycetota bacterium]